MLDVLITNGLVVDEYGNEPYYADIAIKNGRITKIEKNIQDEANEIIDATGIIVSPGFIDVHSHNDLVPFMDENIGRLKAYARGNY